ncbi:unnamed protein product, partial [Allacma fusca]
MSSVWEVAPYGGCNVDSMDVGSVVEIEDDCDDVTISDTETSEDEGDSNGNRGNGQRNILSSDGVFRFSELETPDRVFDHGFSRILHSYHVLNNGTLAEG